MRNTLLLVLFFVFSFQLVAQVAQDNFRLLFQPKLNFDYDVSARYSHEFGIENRNFVYKNSEIDYNVKHIEIAHTSKFKLNENQVIGLGIQYRFQDNFEGSNENELRLIQRFGWNSKKSNFELSQEFKNEQRFYASTTKYRGRYEIALKFPLGNKPIYFLAETEALLELASSQKPEFEHRLSGIFGWELTNKTTFETGLQYRLSDYTQDLSHELFIVFGLDFQSKKI